MKGQSRQTLLGMIQIKIFTVPLLQETEFNDELNKFLRSIKVLDIKKEFVNTADGCYWTFCISYFPIESGNLSTSMVFRKDKIDYKNVLSELEFERFSLMRKVRKALSEEDAIPPFAVFTDAELSEIAKLEKITISGLLEINGIGRKKVEKFGERFCNGYIQLYKDEKNRESEK